MTVSDPPRLQQVRAHIRAGGVLAYPTESCFGLGCAPDDARGLRHLLRLKGRPNHKGMIVIAADVAQLLPYLVPLSRETRQKLARYWPGPYTFLLPASRKVLPLLRGQHRTLAVRVTAHPVARALCRAVGPLVSTSANRAGQVALRQARACRAAFADEVMVWPGQVGARRLPSTIIDFASGRVLR